MIVFIIHRFGIVANKSKSNTQLLLIYDLPSAKSATSSLSMKTKMGENHRSFWGGVRGNACDLSICHLLDLGLDPFVLAPLGDSRWRGPRLLRAIVYDSTDFFEDVLEDADCSYGIISGEHCGF
jgi:hypothetical protein